MCLALRASGPWLRYAALQNLISSFPWIATPHPPPWRNPRKGSNFAIWQPWPKSRDIESLLEEILLLLADGEGPVQELALPAGVDGGGVVSVSGDDPLGGEQPV